MKGMSIFLVLMWPLVLSAQLAVTVSPPKLSGNKAVVPLAMKNGFAGKLVPGATTVFNFVIAADQPFSTTNLTARVQFSRVVLQGGTLADVRKDVQIVPAPK
jgi:hypothetical protein